MKNYLRMLAFLRGYEKPFAMAVALLLLASVFEAFQLPMMVPLFDNVYNNKDISIPNQNLPEFIIRAIDRLNALSTDDLFKGLLIFALVIIIAKNVLTYLYKFILNDISQQVMRDIRSRLYAKFHDLSMSYFSEKRIGELVSRITYDVNMIENAVSYGLIDLFKQSAMCLFFISIPFFIYPKAAIIIFVLGPTIGIPMRQLGKKLRKLSKAQQEKMADINATLVETLGAMQIIKAFNSEEYEKKRFNIQNNQFYKVMMSSVKRLILITPITEIVGSLGALWILVWFYEPIVSGEMSSGVFILFFGSFMQIISPIKKLGNVNALIQRALAANDRIHHVLDEAIRVQEKPGAGSMPFLTESIRFENVRFHYDDETKWVLDGIDLEVKKGELVAFVGPTGTGKTTLANLIPRFYDPVDGQVKMDGVDIKNYTLISLRDQVALVTQDSILFNDTAQSNIAYGRRDAPEHEIVEAAKRAFAHRFIEKLPEGYQTVIGDRGFRLSGGEKQRLSIARAILKNAPILILDEATSQLDSESEKFVQEALDKLMEGRTVLAIAHRLSTVKKADKIVVLEDGKIVGLGPHESLLKTCPLYKKLHDMQFHD